MEEKPPKITQQDIDTILKYLPIFEEPSFSAGQVVNKPRSFPYYEFGPGVNSFISDLADHGFVFVFDWPAWQEEAIKFFENPSLLYQADIITLQKLFTTHVRKDRFCEGHLASVIESGHIAAMLRRLKQIRVEQKL